MNLKEAREKRGLTQEEAAELIGVTAITVSRWERGESIPRPFSVPAICKTYAATPEELGLKRNNIRERDGSRRDFEGFRQVIRRNFAVYLESFIYLCASPDQVRLAITQAVEEHTTMEMSLPATFSRRAALQHIAALPIWPAALLSVTRPHSSSDLIKQCAAGITACQYLSRGEHEDIALAFEAMTQYINILTPLATKNGKEQREAANLATQSLTLKALIASHFEPQTQAVAYAEKAINFARITNDPTTLIMAIDECANQYRHNEQYDEALNISTEAEALIKKHSDRIPAALSSMFFSGYAVYQAHHQHHKEALQMLGKAEDMFEKAEEEKGNTMPGSHHSHANLIGGQAHVHMFLRNYNTAFELRSKIIDLKTPLTPKMPGTPLRTHVFGLIHTTRLSLRLPAQQKDAEISKQLWKAAWDGTMALQSTGHKKELKQLQETMECLWPDDNEIADYHDLIDAWKE